MIYIALDQFAEAVAPGFPTPAGYRRQDQESRLGAKKVRVALSLAIDRKGIVDKIMEGVVLPAGDFLPWPAFGSSKTTQPDKYDPAQAKKLLAEAGYPGGFSITLGTPNGGRYINDLKVAQAVASMWSRIGVKTEVEGTRRRSSSKRRDEYQCSAYLARLGHGLGRDVSPLRPLVATPATPGKGE